MDNARFRPVRGLEATIQAAPIIPGYVYFAQDSRKIYLDIEDPETGTASRVLMTSAQSGGGGGSNSGIFYGIRETSEEEDEKPTLEFTIADIEGDVLPGIDDLIINEPDSCFYRVIELNNTISVIAKRLTVAGSGGESYTSGATVEYDPNAIKAAYIEGQENYLTITPYSATNKAGTYLDPFMQLEWSIRNSNDTSIIYASGTQMVANGVPIDFEFGTKVSAGTSSVYNQIWFTLTGANSGTMKAPVKATVLCVKMTLQMHKEFDPLTVYGHSFTMSCNVSGAIEKILVWKLDNAVVRTDILPASGDGSSGRQQCVVQDVERGAHKVKIELYQSLAGEKGASVTPLEFEIAVASKDDESTAPIIWTGSYQSQYNNYDRIVIPFMVYNPQSETSLVRFYKNAAELSVSPVNVTYTTGVEFSKLEIIDATISSEVGKLVHNTYQIISGDTVKEVEFDVLQTGKMLLGQQDSLLVNFSSAGRSNNESAVSRPVWSFNNPNQSLGEVTGIFEGFNWYNNGWVTDADGNTCLRISNGARFSIPIGQITMNSTTAGSQSYTFEFQFKIRNIQNYEKLISLVTHYYLDENQTQDDTQIYELYRNEYATVYDTYDQFLQWYLPTIGRSYDDLVYRSVESVISASTALCNYYDGTNGFCLGTQDAFFKTNVGTLTSNYVEDQIINLTLIYSKTKKLAYIYLNGVLDGAAQIPDTNAFTIEKNAIVFNSDFCDIDLYKVRVYNIDFAVGEVLNNYAVDLRDVQLYNESNSLVRDDDNLDSQVLDFDKMITYNQEHPDEYLMPYILFQNVDTGALPYSKADAKSADMTFVNTGLDHDYAAGLLVEKAKNYSVGEVKVAWITPNLAAELAEAYPANQATSAYWFMLNGTKTYVAINYNMLWGQNGETKLDWKFKKKAATLPDSDEVDPAKSYEICVFRHLDNVSNFYLHHGASFHAVGGEIKTQGTSSQFYPRRNYKYKGKEVMIANKGPFEIDPMWMEYFFMDNDDVGTNKFTLKIDFMESSGSYNTGLANLSQTAYTKHPLFDYDFANDLNISNLRTSIWGFPTMAFHEKADGSTVYIGRYNMNLDKGSDECFGYKLFVDNDPQGTKVKTNYVKDKKGKILDVAKAAECWEFSDNNRGFCSFRDPQGRYVGDISDEPGAFFSQKVNGVEQSNAKGTCPIVCDSFEYRYNTHGDAFDYLYGEPIKDSDKEDIADDLGTENLDTMSYEDKCAKTFEWMKNWERAVKWVYSTDTESVGSEADLFTRYGQIHDNKVYKGPTTKLNPTTGESIDALIFDAVAVDKDISEVKDAVTAAGFTEAQLKQLYGIVDAEQSTATVEVKKLTNDSYGQAYAAISGFEYIDSTEVAGAIAAASEFDADTTYFVEDSGDYIEADPQPTADNFASGSYFYYPLTITCHFNGGEVLDRSVVSTALQEDVATYETSNIRSLPAVYVSGNNNYYFDTKEYRLAKFAKEFTQHFDKEYACVYFIITELLMCYDSRGKNAMFASWGPQVEGGDYIWYPIFYDLDTQLGINNTGIPSFEYFTNASEDGCFSTNDSILWTNMYKVFLDDIKKYYQFLRTSVKTRAHGSTPESNNHAPFAGIEYGGQEAVEHIENWYTCKPETTKSICMQGHRPLVAINMDEFYKYIFIMMNVPGGGYQGTEAGQTKYDTSGSFLYALQGDRSLSRQQFLKRRINFIDSWLTRGNYAEGTGVTIKFRTSANDPENTSDHWIEGSNNGIGSLTPNAPYYVTPETFDDFGDRVKTQELDADFFIKLTPFQRSYVTLATDNAPLPSKEYSGSAVRVDFPTNVVTGVRTSPRYAEQLLYVYGADYLKDIGDVSLLYPREFEIDNASHLQKIILGNDTPGYFNNKLKSPKFGAEANSATGKPLLKEVVFTNVKIDGDGIYPLDFGSAEKLQIFRALGMNLSTVTFADGVALHTLHLPSTVTEFVLREARSLDTIIDNYVAPTRNTDKSWNAQRGLYIQGLTDATSVATTTSNISRFEIVGGSLGYGSYDLLKKLYDKYEAANTGTLTIGLEEVHWTPYTKLEKGYVYNSDEASKYYIDNEHYQLELLTAYDNGRYASTDFTTGTGLTIWNDLIRQGMLYIRDTNVSNERIASISDLQMLIDLAEDSKYKGTNSANTNIPVLTGDIYVDNSVEDIINESDIKNIIIDQYYPNLHIFVTNVRKAYSAKFIKIDGDNYEVVGTQKVDPDQAVTKIWFDDPYVQYASLTSRDHYDFNGWSTAEGDTTKVIYQAVYQPNMYYTYNQATKSYDQSSEYNANETYYYKTPGQDKYSVVILTTDSDKIWSAQTYTEGVYEYNFYIIYNRHKYLMKYLNMDGSVITTQEVPYGDYLVQPAGIPAAPAAMLNALPVEKTYVFKGYNTDADATDVLALTEIASSQDMNFNAIFSQLDVHDPAAVYPESAFDFIAGSYTSAYGETNSDYYASGWVLRLKSDVVLAGKVTVPVMHNGEPVVGVVGFGADGNSNPNTAGVTHIFFERNENSQLRYFGTVAFRAMENLKYIEIPDSVRFIGDRALQGCTSLDITNFGNNVNAYGSSCFSNSFIGNNGTQMITINIPGDTTRIYDSAFRNLGTSMRPVGIAQLNFGGTGDPTAIMFVDPESNGPFSQRSAQYYIQAVNFYGVTQAEIESRENVLPGINGRLATGATVQYLTA